MFGLSRLDDHHVLTTVCGHASQDCFYEVAPGFEDEDTSTRRDVGMKQLTKECGFSAAGRADDHWPVGQGLQCLGYVGCGELVREMNLEPGEAGVIRCACSLGGC